MLAIHFQKSVVAKQIAHIVHAGGLVLHEHSRVDRARGEHAPRLRLVLDGDDLIVTGEDDLMLADDRAAADGVDADLVMLALRS